MHVGTADEKDKEEPDEKDKKKKKKKDKEETDNAENQAKKQIRRTRRKSCCRYPAPSVRRSRTIRTLMIPKLFARDIHGYIKRLQLLWARLEEELGRAKLNSATLVFLGDYCDRVPHTREVFDFLVKLRESREPGRTVLVTGNHDFGMAAFLGCLPVDVPHPDLDSTNITDYKTGFWPHAVEGGMHYQGRRWAGSTSYESSDTFESYGVKWDPTDPDLRNRFMKAVPEEHKTLLREMRWVHEQSTPWSPGRVVCVHAGLGCERPAALQLEALHARDLSLAVLHEDGNPGRIEAFSGRYNLLQMHPELEGQALLISGHHGVFSIQGDRIINDRSRGTGGVLEAILLPSRRVIPHRSS